MITRAKWQRYWRNRDKVDRVKCNIRWTDRYFFKTHLPKEMYDRYEVCHDWENGAVCRLLTPFECRGARYKGNIKKDRG